jgi:cytochrome c-type biogenesis protein CcmH/NrfF
MIADGRHRNPERKVARELSNYIYYMLKEGKDFNQVINYNKSQRDLG